MESIARVVSRHDRGELSSPSHADPAPKAAPTEEAPAAPKALPEPARRSPRTPEPRAQLDEPDAGPFQDGVPLVNGYWHFRNQLAAYPVPTAEQHADLGKRVAAGRAAADMLLDGDLLTPRRKAQLRMISRGGERAREHLLLSNMGLVFTYARRRVPGMESVDLVQVGIIGLHRAIEKYDVALGYRFSTYATWWIRQQIERAIADQSSLIRVPVHVHETIRARRRKQAKLERHHQRALDPQQLRQLLGPEPPTLPAYTRATSVESLDLHLEAIEEGSVSPRRITGEPWEDLGPDDDVGTTHVEKHLDTLIEDTLPARQALILRGRLALNDETRKYTLEELGEQLGLTRERIRQLESKALAKLRRELVTTLELQTPEQSTRLVASEIESFVATLPPDERCVLKRRSTGKSTMPPSIREVARAMGRSETWVILTELRAREHLRRFLGTPHPDLHLAMSTTAPSA